MERFAAGGNRSAQWIVWASYALAAVSLWMVLHLHMLPALLAGLLVYALVQAGTPLLGRHISGARARALVVTVLAVLVVGLLSLLVFGLISLLRNELGNPDDLWQRQLMPMVARARQQLPASVDAWLPDSVEDLRVTAMELTRKHAPRLQSFGKDLGRGLLQLAIGVVLGGIVALSDMHSRDRSGPLAMALAQRCQRLAGAFGGIVFAQFKISVINTVFTAVFLLGGLPLCGVHLPLAKTLVAATFLIGLLPVIGNVISNLAITIVGLSVSLWVGVAALGFLIVIHKLEYFLNARIVGTQIRARAWELLVAMLLMEAAFGLAGVIAAPIYYAYLKRELEAARLI